MPFAQSSGRRDQEQDRPSSTKREKNFASVPHIIPMKRLTGTYQVACTGETWRKALCLLSRRRMRLTTPTGNIPRQPPISRNGVIEIQNDSDPQIKATRLRLGRILMIDLKENKEQDQYDFRRLDANGNQCGNFDPRHSAEYNYGRRLGKKPGSRRTCECSAVARPASKPGNFGTSMPCRSGRGSPRRCLPAAEDRARKDRLASLAHPTR